MPIQFKCPQCGGLLSVSTRHVGATITCPLNGCLITLREEDRSSDKTPSGRFKVEAATGAPSAIVASAVGAPPRVQSNGSPATAKPSGPSAGNSARFITAEASPSVIQLAPDGRLPELQLQEGAARRAGAERIKGASPKALGVLLGLSAGLSVLLLLADFSPSAPRAKEQSEARSQLAKKFYGQPQQSLAPYQQLLREAQQAHSRGDRSAERELYRRVLKLLRAEGRPRYESLTRTPREDKELEELLAVLLIDEK